MKTKYSHNLKVPPYKYLFLTKGKIIIHSVETGRHHFNQVFNIYTTSNGANQGWVPPGKMQCQEHSVGTERRLPPGVPNRSLFVWKHETNSNPTKWMAEIFKSVMVVKTKESWKTCPRMRETKEIWPLSVTPFAVKNVFGTISQTWILYKNYMVVMQQSSFTDYVKEDLVKGNT